MKRSLFVISVITVVAGCKLQADSNAGQVYDPTKVYKLQVKPAPGSNYHYDIVNETAMNMEVEGKELENRNKSTVSSDYFIANDSVGNLLLTMKFDKIRLYSKNNDKEKEIDADNGKYSLDPVEKMLFILKETNMQSVMKPNGESAIITGFKEIGDKIMTAFPATDENTKMGLEVEWNKTIGESLVKRNTDQLFRIYPDSAVHVGDTWKISSKQDGQIGYSIMNIFKLKAINNDIAIIESQGTITSENITSSINSFGNNAVINIQGEQQGEYQVEAKTGMLINSKVKGNIKGTVQVMGREIPLTLTTSVAIHGKRVSN